MVEDLRGERALVEKVFERTLPSGLKVLFIPYMREKVVSVYLCAKVGSKYEWDEVAGITHLIEHMIFKGGEGQKPGEVAGKVEAQGGYINAFTSYDQTCYYVIGPIEVFETALDVLSQAVFKPYFDPLELEREKEVVVEEMKMRLDNPMIVLFEELMKASYTSYPYKRPIIGFENTVRNIKREDLFYFIDHFYTPENMVLVIAGNFEYNQIEPLLLRYFGDLPKRILKKVSFPEETYVSSPKLVWIERPVKESYFAISFPGPSIRSDEAPIAKLLAEILGGGESSRLYLRLKRDLNLVKTISADALTPDGPGLIKFIGTAEPHNFKEILKVFVEELEKLKREGPSPQELEKAKIQILSSFIYSQETSEGLARQIASFQILRDSYRDILWYKDRIEKATVEDLRTIAKKYLTLEKMVTVFLSEKALFEEEEYRKLLLDRPKTPSPEIFALDNGLKVILHPIRDIPTVGMALVFPGGTRFENPQNNGLFQALTLLWTRGTKNYSAEAIAEKLESLGASIKGFSGRNTFGLKAISLSDKFSETLKLFSDIINNPTFDQAEIEKARPELISLVLMQEDQPLSLALREFLKSMFPDHPYGLNQAGSKEFYLTVDSKTLREAYERFVLPQHGVLVITGDFDKEELKKKLKEFLGSLPRRELSLPEEPLPTLPQERRRRVHRESFQSQILLGFSTPGLLSSERVALEILNSALSGQDGRLFRILRDERSLAYAVTSFLVFYPKASVLSFYIGCSPEKETQAIEGFFEILEEIRKNGLSPEELERAKRRLLGRQRMALQSNLAKAEDMAINEALGLGWNFSSRYEELVRATNQDDIKNLIEKYLHKDRAFLLILGR